MPAALMSKEKAPTRRMGIFRERGYEDASLAELSEATGLGRSSLYHYFPVANIARRHVMVALRWRASRNRD